MLLSNEKRQVSFIQHGKKRKVGWCKTFENKTQITLLELMALLLPQFVKKHNKVNFHEVRWYHEYSRPYTKQQCM